MHGPAAVTQVHTAMLHNLRESCGTLLLFLQVNHMQTSCDMLQWFVKNPDSRIVMQGCQLVCS